MYYALVAVISPGIAERLTGYGDELPGITVGMQGQPKNAIRGSVADLAVGRDGGYGSMVGAARADDELADAASRIEAPAGGLWRKALIDMSMTVQDHIGVGIVK